MRKHLKKIVFSIIFSLLVVAGVSLSEYFPDVIVTSPNGLWTDTRAYTSLNAAITAVGANKRDIYIIRQEAVSSLTVPSTVRLHFFASGSIANTGQLTINTRDIFAGNYQIFTGAGNIDFVAGSIVRTSWFNSIESAFALTVNDTVTLLVTSPQTITASYSPGNNVFLKWESPGNILTVDAGVTVSNLRNIEAGQYQILAGAGTFRFVDGISLNLSWVPHLRSALTWINTTKATIVINKTYVVDYSDTVPANVALRINKGGDLSISNGVTLTIAGIVDSFGDDQIFKGLGTALITKMSVIYSSWFGSDTAALIAGVNSATASGGILKVPHGTGTYALTGATTIVLDLGKMSFDCDAVIFDRTAMTATYAFQIYSTNDAFPDNSLNNLHYAKGFGIQGDYATLNRGGILFGYTTHNVHTRSDQVEVSNFFIQGCSPNLAFTDNTWRPLFRRGTILNPVAGSYNILLPSGLDNTGEVIKFEDIEIVGGTVSIGNTSQVYIQGSLLNSSVEVGSSSHVDIKGNMENVGVADYYFVNVLGTDSIVSIDGTLQPRWWGGSMTSPPFTGVANSKLVFHNVTWPGRSSTFLFETALKYKAFVGGDITVEAHNSSYWPSGGDGEPAVSAALNSIVNASFELSDGSAGSTTGWTITPYPPGQVVTTCSAVAAAAYAGNYGLRCINTDNTNTAGTNITQTFPARPGQLVIAGVNNRVVSKTGVGVAGYFSIYFLNSLGTLIPGYQFSENITSSTWAWVGSGLTYYAPPGTVSVKVELNVSHLATPSVIDWDFPIVNVL